MKLNFAMQGLYKLEKGMRVFVHARKQLSTYLQYNCFEQRTAKYIFQQNCIVELGGGNY